MNRVLLLLSLLIMSVSGWTQTHVSIGSGNYNSNGGSPLNTYYNNSASQTIYLASEVADTGTIVTMSFRNLNSSLNTSRNVKVYMATTSLSQFSSSTDALTLTDLTLVYQGSYNIVGGQWSEIELTTPFHYDGTQNLVVGVEDYNNVYWDGGRTYWQSTSATGRSICNWDDNNLVPINLSGADVYNFYPDVNFTISADGSFCRSMTNVEVSNITTNSATISWNERDDASTFYYQVKRISDSWVEDGDESVSTDSVILDNLDASTTYEVRIKADCEFSQSSYKTVTFTTNCSEITTLPWMTDFEYDSEDSVPSCWSILNPYYGIPCIGESNWLAYSGTKFLGFASNGTTKSVAILPEFETSLDELQLSFYSRRDGISSGTFYVGYITDVTDANTFVALDSIDANGIGDDEYHLWEVSYANITIDEQITPRMALAYNTNNTSWYWYVDNVEVREIPACTRPNRITSLATDNSVTINWTSTGTDFEVYYKETDSINYQLATNFTSAPTQDNYTITLENLTPATQYSYYIKVICDDSLTSEVKRFKTECVPIDTLPVTWDFETYDEQTYLPPCWQNIEENGAYVTDNSYLSGDYSLNLDVGNTTILPLLDSSIAINTLQLRFFAQAPYYYYGPVTLEVGVMTDVNNDSSFVSIASVDANSITFSEKIVLFSNYQGDGKHIAVRCTGGSYSIRIDDVTLEVMPDCIPVQNIVATTITSDSIAFTWAGNNDTYFVRYKAEGETQWSTQNLTTNGASASISGLSANTNYIVSIAPDCDETTEDTYRTATITTLCSSFEVPYFMNFEDESLLNCWIVAQQSEDDINDYPYLVTSSSLSNLSTHCYAIGGDNTGAMVVVAPKINLDIEQTRLQFNIRKNDTASTWGDVYEFGNIEIGVMTNPNDTSTFVSLYTIEDSTITTTYSLQTVDFNQFTQYTGSNYYVAIKYLGTASRYSYSCGEYLIDDVKIDNIPSCNEATNIVFNNVTVNSVDISWVSEATNFKIYYKPLDSNEDYQSEDVTLTGGVYTLQNLTPATPYAFYVATVCSDNSESNSNTYTFTTACVSIDVPYTINFESVSVSQRPLCWSFINSKTENEYTYPCVTADGYHSGHASAKGMEFHSTSNVTTAAIAVLPEFTESIGNLSVEFWTRPESDPANGEYRSGRLDVGYVTDLTDASTFVIVDSISVYDLADTAYHRYRVNFDSVDLDNSTTGYIAFRHVPNSNYYYWYLDDITVETIPACAYPVNLAASNASSNGIDLTWMATETSVTLYYKESSATEFDSIENVSLNENGVYTLENLQPNTTYNWKVGYNCHVDNQNYYSEAINFTTACGMIDTLPQTWGFEAADNTAGTASYPLPACWQRVGSAYPYSSRYPTVNSGSYCLYFSTVGDIGILPQIDTSVLPLNTLQLSFYARSYYTDTLKIGVMTDPVDATTFTEISYVIVSDDYTFFEIPFINYDGNATYIAFRNSASTTYRSMYVDDVTLELAPACTTPNNVQITSTTNEATVSWASTGSSFEVYYKESSETDYNTPITTATAGEDSDTWTATISGLNPATAYNVYVKAICNEESQPQSQVVTFRTQCATITNFPYTEGFETFSDEDFACWTNEIVTGTRSWAIRTSATSGNYAYRNFTEGSTRLISPVFDITSLTSPMLSYNWEAHSDAGANDSLYVYYRTSSTSDWTVLASHGPNSSSSISNITQTNTVALPSASDTYQIAFLASCHEGYGVGIDNVVISDNDAVVTPVEPTVATNVATNIAQTTATLNGAITDAGNQTITAKGFEWKATNGGTYAQVLSTAAGNTLTYNLTNLTANTSYTYKAFATTANGTVYGTEQVFTTLQAGDEPCTPLTATVTETLCYGETFTFNGQTYNASGTYTTTVAGQSGDCDTLYTINLTILPQNTASITETLCYGETFTFNGQTYNATGTYTTTVAGQSGDCDTLYTINLTILPQNTPINDEVTISQRELPYTYHGEIYTDFGSYTLTTQDENGCDQVYNLTLVHNSGISEVEGGLTISLYPNPTDDNATLRVKGLSEQATIIITDQQGRVVSSKVLAQGVETLEVETTNLASGVYYIRIQTANTIKTEKLIKK